MPDGAESTSNTSHPSHVIQQSPHPILQIFLSNLGSAIMGRICSPRVLKAKMDPLLQRLDPTHRPMRNHRGTTNLVVGLQTLDLPKKKVNLPPPVPLEFQLGFFTGGPGVRRGKEEERFLM